MLKFIIITTGTSIILFSCAHTIPAPLNTLKKSESKHTIYSQGYQYQRGLSDVVEIGFDLNMMSIGGNLRYHLSNSDQRINSLQLGFGYGGIINRKIIKFNYKHTFKLKSETFFRFGPFLNYSFETKNFDDSIDYDTGKKIYRTMRLGLSLTYGGENWWMNFSYSHPYYKNYGDIDFHLFYDELEEILYGNPIYGPDMKVGYSF